MDVLNEEESECGWMSCGMRGRLGRVWVDM